MKPSVGVVERGREAQVVYREGLLRTITGYQEFGGGDVVAIISMGNEKDWRKQQSWALERRAEILRFIADELIRMKAPGCVAEIDLARGDILLRERPA